MKKSFKIVNLIVVLTLIAAIVAMPTGATKENIIKILIYENIYMFIKSTIISIILSIPILYAIIKSMTKTIILDKILIPFTSIGIFILLLFIISLIIAIYSVKFIKEE